MTHPGWWASDKVLAMHPLQAMLKYDAKAREVQMVVDRAYAPGDPVYAWCGPQPNRRLLLNYSIVDDDNPYGADLESNTRRLLLCLW